MIKTDEELKSRITDVMTNGLSKQLNVMVNSGRYNSARYFISDEKENSDGEKLKKLNEIEDYLIDKIIEKEIK